jgi:hypothetical protein
VNGRNHRTGVTLTMEEIRSFVFRLPPLLLDRIDRIDRTHIGKKKTSGNTIGIMGAVRQYGSWYEAIGRKTLCN